MRIALKTIEARAGNLVRVSIHRGKSDFAKVSVYSRVGDYDFAPHVDVEASNCSLAGKPVMMRPKMATVTAAHPSNEIQFITSERMDVCVMHEADTAKDIAPKIKVKQYGKAHQAIRRYCRNTVRRLRSLYDPIIPVD